MAVKPGPQLLGAHPVDASGTGVLLDASERLGKVLAGQELLPQAPPRRGERRCRPAPGRCCALAGRPRASPLDPPRQTPEGVGCDQCSDHEHERPDARLRVGPSQRYRSPLVIRPLLTSPQRATPSRAPAVPHHPANQTDGASGTPVETSTNKTSNLHRTPTAFTDRPLDGHRASPRGSRLARAAPPYTRSPPNPSRSPVRPCVPRVATRHSGFLPTQPRD